MERLINQRIYKKNKCASLRISDFFAKTEGVGQLQSV